MTLDLMKYDIHPFLLLDLYLVQKNIIWYKPTSVSFIARHSETAINEKRKDIRNITTEIKFECKVS